MRLLILLSPVLTFAQSPLKPVVNWTLPDVEGRPVNKTDHLYIDAPANRLFASAKSIDSVFVIDLNSGDVIATIPVHAPQGLGITRNAKGSDLLWVGSDDDGVLSAFDLKANNKLTFSVNFSAPGAESGEADDIEIDELTQAVLVAVGDDGSGSSDPSAIATVDSATGKVVASVATAAHIEGFKLVRGSDILFANSPHATPNSVLKISRKGSGSILSSWTLPAGTGGNTPIVLDGRGGRLFLGCRTPPMLLVLDSDTGEAVFNSTNMVADNDDLFLDPASGHIFASGGGVSAGKGAISTWRVDGRGDIAYLGDISPAGKNSILDPFRRRVYTTVEADGATEKAYIAVYEY